MLKRILLAATAGLFLLAGAVTYAHSAERTCMFQMTEKIAELQNEPQLKNTVATPLSAEESERLEAVVGSPPVDKPYSVSLVAATVPDGSRNALIFIHDKDCVLMVSRPFEEETLMTIIKGRKAGQ